MFILDCTELDQMCYNWKPILIVFKYIINILQWTVPLILLVLGSIDMFKAMTRADKDEAVTDARKSLIKRIIYGLVIFLVPFVVRLILNIVEDNTINNGDYVGATSWISCWNNVMDKDYSDCDDIYKKKNQDSIVDDDNEQNDDNQNKTVCYVYDDYSCPTECNLDNSVLFNSIGCKCTKNTDYELTDDNNGFNYTVYDDDTLRTMCYSDFGEYPVMIEPHSTNKTAYYCIYDPIKTKKGHKSKPELNITYETRICDASVNCDTEYSFCKPQN